MDENEDIQNAIEIIHQHHLRLEAMVTIKRHVRNIIIKSWIII